MVRLSELDYDALVEIFNIGVGRAAAAMSSIVGEEVVMSVPAISFESRVDAARLLCVDQDTRICGIRQHYAGAFNTEAVLMFPEDRSLDIVRLMVGDAVSVQEHGEMEQEAMSEIGNIILNACMGMLADIFESELEGSLPSYHVGTSAEILSAGSQSIQPQATVLMLRINFFIVKYRIEGYVAFLLDTDALADLHGHLGRYTAKYTDVK